MMWFNVTWSTGGYAGIRPPSGPGAADRLGERSVRRNDDEPGAAQRPEGRCVQRTDRIATLSPDGRSVRSDNNE
jgi:hypothetical protein